MVEMGFQFTTSQEVLAKMDNHFKKSKEKLLKLLVEKMKSYVKKEELIQNDLAKDPILKFPNEITLISQNTIQEQCPICYNNIALKEMQITLNCSHKFCKNCIERYITTEIMEGNVLEIKCPIIDCLKILKERDIENNCGSPEMFNKYLKFRYAKQIEINKNYK
jgi:hypothetical protein